MKPTPLGEQAKASPATSGYGIPMKPTPADAATKYGFGKAQTFISFVEPSSPADKAGLQAGDVVLEVNGTANPSSDQIKTAGGSGTLVMRIGRKDARFFVAVAK